MPSMPIADNPVRTRRRYRHKTAAALVTFAIAIPAMAQVAEIPLTRRIAETAMHQWPNGQISSKGQSSQRTYELGLLLEGLGAAWYTTADRDDYQYIKSSVDRLVSPDGTFTTNGASSRPLDDISAARQLLLLYRVTLDKRYFQAATSLHRRFAFQPDTTSDGLSNDAQHLEQTSIAAIYFNAPFRAEYASVFHQSRDFAEITQQFTRIEQHVHDANTGFLSGWDAAGQNTTARSAGATATLSAREMGWFVMALVDALPYYPEEDSGRSQLLATLRQIAAAIVQHQDSKTGLWFHVPKLSGAKDNSLDLAASSMFTYALARAVRLCYLGPEYAHSAQFAWQGIQGRLAQKSAQGEPGLASDDPLSAGSVLLAATEMESAADAALGRGSRVLLDAWYNSQTRTNAAGQEVLFHYKWDDYSNSGFSLFGETFRRFGVATRTLASAPTLDNLKDAQFYVIASPDNLSKNAHPHYMNDQDAEQIAEWVKQGGILVLMENDPDNADIPHFDALADRFGLHFNNVLTHHVIGDQFAMGRMDLTEPRAPFHKPHVLYMKDTCSLALSRDATALLEWKGDILMASAHYGKGTVVAVTDPWLYNEYTDGRKLPPEYDNFAAGREFVRWLLQLR